MMGLLGMIQERIRRWRRLVGMAGLVACCGCLTHLPAETQHVAQDEPQPADVTVDPAPVPDAPASHDCPCATGGACDCAGDCACQTCRCVNCPTPDAKPAEPTVSLKDRILSSGRYPRVLAFGVDEDCDTCVALRLHPSHTYTCGRGDRNVVQIMPDDPQLREAFGITRLPTFLRIGLVNGKPKITHRMDDGRQDFKSVINAIHGKQCYPPKAPGVPVLYQWPRGAVCTTG